MALRLIILRRRGFASSRWSIAASSTKASRSRRSRPASREGGRNNYGRITVRFRGGGHKQAYRIIDFKRRKFDAPGTVERLEYDPNRTSFIAAALSRRRAGLHHRAAAPRRRRDGDRRRPGRCEAGNAMPLANIPVGTIVHNVETKIGKGGALARSAAPTLRSSAATRVTSRCASARASSGCARPVLRHRRRGVEPDHMKLRSARPGATAGSATVRTTGVTMNPVDHPHGGGEAARRAAATRSPVGQADQRQEDTFEQGHGQVHRRFAARP